MKENGKAMMQALMGGVKGTGTLQVSAVKALMGGVKGSCTLQVPVDASINGWCERNWYTPSSGRESNYPTERKDYQCIDRAKYMSIVCTRQEKQEKTSCGKCNINESFRPFISTPKKYGSTCKVTTHTAVVIVQIQVKPSIKCLLNLAATLCANKVRFDKLRT